MPEFLCLRLAFCPLRQHLLYMTVLQKRDLARQQRRLDVFAETRRRLQSALSELIPGQRVILFGSLTKPGTFNDRSDVDLAVETEPSQMSAERLISELMDRLERPVDVLLLDRCHFREKILREGELWIA
jgi:predicted nucleotidyltransferase